MLVIQNIYKLNDQKVGHWTVSSAKVDEDMKYYRFVLEYEFKPNNIQTFIIHLSSKKNENGNYYMIAPHLTNDIGECPIKEVSAENIKTLLHIKFRLLQFLKQCGVEWDD